MGFRRRPSTDGWLIPEMPEEPKKQKQSAENAESAESAEELGGTRRTWRTTEECGVTKRNLILLLQ